MTELTLVIPRRQIGALTRELEIQQRVASTDLHLSRERSPVCVQAAAAVRLAQVSDLLDQCRASTTRRRTITGDADLLRAAASAAALLSLQTLQAAVHCHWHARPQLTVLRQLRADSTSCLALLENLEAAPQEAGLNA